MFNRYRRLKNCARTSTSHTLHDSAAITMSSKVNRKMGILTPVDGKLLKIQKPN